MEPSSLATCYMQDVIRKKDRILQCVTKSCDETF